MIVSFLGSELICVFMQTSSLFYFLQREAELKRLHLVCLKLLHLHNGRENGLHEWTCEQDGGLTQLVLMTEAGARRALISSGRITFQLSVGAQIRSDGCSSSSSGRTSEAAASCSWHAARGSARRHVFVRLGRARRRRRFDSFLTVMPSLSQSHSGDEGIV